MKEKIGIEKLIELLNEYLNDKVGYIQYHNENGFKRTPTKSAVEGDRMLQDEYVLGKSFGFIKWLVENDKIKDLEEIDYIYGPELVNHQTEIIYTPYSLYDSLLMLLSISDTPIEDLISYLK